MKISIVLPFNKVDDNLNRCIESFLFGSDKNVEIILSPFLNITFDEIDRITQIKSSKVLYIESVAEDIINARNNALTHVTGDYVLFPEPDDWVSRDFVRSLNQTLKSSSVDLLIFSYYMQKKESCFEEHKLERKNDKFYGFDLVYPLWNKVFSMNIIRNKKMGSGGDFSLLYKCIESIEKDRIVWLEKPLYYRGLENKLNIYTASPVCDKRKLKKCFILLGFALRNYYQQELIFLWNKFNTVFLFRISRKLDECKKAKKETKRRKVLRREIRHFNAAEIPDEISIISQNCIGGIIYHDLKRQNLSPTINLYMEANDFIRFVKNLPKYLSIEPIVEWGEAFPVGVLDDIHIYFRHYKTCSEALEAWNRRRKRVQLDKIVVICSDRYNFSDESYEMWKTIDYPKLLFTCKKKYADESSVYYKKYSKKDFVPDLIPYREFYKDDRLRTLLAKIEGI